MLIGVNTPALLQADLEPRGAELRDRLTEADARSCRVPIAWGGLDPEGTGTIARPAAARRIDWALRHMSEGSTPLGVILNPSGAVAARFFEDPTSLSEPFAAFCAALAKRFPAIRDWEVWNEPNASDFYLSVRDGDGARPWTPEEFVEHMLLPGARALKRARPDARLCIAAVAEDGLVGHEDRPPALSNRLPRSPEFEPFRVDHPYGHFFFVPDFLEPFCTALVARAEEVSALFDACAYHPYPYFRIHHRGDARLMPATETHTADFLRVTAAHGLAELEVWATEFGARSLAVAGQHANDPAQQADYAEAAFALLAAEPRVTRAYWYKLMDLPWDLQQEKTFGLLDHGGNPRPVFTTFKAAARAAHADLPRTALVEGMQYARLHGGAGLDPEDWQVACDTWFGYTLGSQTESGAGELLVVPGRQAGNRARMTARRPLDAPQARKIEVALDGRTLFDSGRVEIELILTQAGAPETAVIVDIGGAVALRVRQGDAEQAGGLRPRDYPIATGAGFSGVEAAWIGDSLCVWLVFGEVRLHRSFTVAPPRPDVPVGLSVGVARRGGRPAFVSLRRIAMRLALAGDPLSAPPMNRADEQALWFLSLHSYSQIFQDDWVLQMLRFKRCGFFAEIGGHDGVANSNTVLLERLFDWQGLIVEANPRWHAEVCRNRTAIAYNLAAFSEGGRWLEFVDAGAIGGLTAHLQEDIHASKRADAIRDGRVIRVMGARVDEMLARAAAPALVDYVSIDTEGSEVEVLHSIDFAAWRIALMTIEHSGVEAKRAEILEILEPLGYRRARTWFEDWFYHPEHLAAVLDVTPDEAEAHATAVWRRERYARRSRLMREGTALRSQGEHAAAAALFEEAAKTFHPDTVHPLAEAIVSRRAAGDGEAAADLSRRARARFPSHPRIQRQTEITLGTAD